MHSYIQGREKSALGESPHFIKPGIAIPVAEPKVHPLLHLQPMVGNKAIQRLIVQANLTISQPGDKYEQEADRIAEQVMKVKGPEEKGEEILQAKEIPGKAPEVSFIKRRLYTPPNSGLKYLLNNSGQGEPLDTTLRARLEKSFGYDFSPVRIHTGRQAEGITMSLGARALTSGPDIWLGKDEHPNDIALFAHELTHVIQQQVAPTGTSIGTTSIPSVQLLRVIPNGQFAAALEEFTNLWHVPDESVQLLHGSGTFREIVRILNTRYVSWEDPDRIPGPVYEENGIVITGPFSGRRIIRVMGGSGRAFFIPYGAPGNDLGYDVIYIGTHPPGNFIEEIAHEASHAVELVTGNSPPAASIMSEIGDAIQEEQRVRGVESTVVNEIQERGGLIGFTPTAHPMEIWAIERDFVRIGEYRTYLENSFFDIAMRRAIAQERLDGNAIGQIDREVSQYPIDDSHVGSFLRNPNNFWLSNLIPTRFGRLLFLRRVIHQSWTAFLDDNPPSIEGFDDLKEEQLQNHARSLRQIGMEFFGEGINYSPRPSTSTGQSFWEQMLSH